MTIRTNFFDVKLIESTSTRIFSLISKKIDRLKVLACLVFVNSVSVVIVVLFCCSCNWSIRRYNAIDIEECVKDDFDINKIQLVKKKKKYQE
jgi:hypothetical protein